MGLQSYRHMGKIITILEDIQYFCYQYSAHQGGRRGVGDSTEKPEQEYSYDKNADL